ncbi:hypothetical protein SAMN06295924_10332 [Rathayibacter rathayi NCPPB 2980 = VKM Ac-1601]|nr:hypothetical protein SAMN06295924_10332 [Rathayibacter rathayi NCPPB 2980 = VKM Ac-1601]
MEPPPRTSTGRADSTAETAPRNESRASSSPRLLLAGDHLGGDPEDPLDGGEEVLAIGGVAGGRRGDEADVLGTGLRRGRAG